MIPIRRGEEPESLRRVRLEELEQIKLLRSRESNPELRFQGYRVTSERLWRMQHFKCCYCEHRIQRAYNDVEHYRPKAVADRTPGCSERHGYWWLAWTWSNLLYSCPSCNRSSKNVLFPLAKGDQVLLEYEEPPGKENPYLLDPAGEVNPVEHIHYRPITIGRRQDWLAVARGGSPRGSWTIEVCKLNRMELMELRRQHVEEFVRPSVAELAESCHALDVSRTHRAFLRLRSMLAPTATYVALSYDAISSMIADLAFHVHGLVWPMPGDVPVSADTTVSNNGTEGGS